jgi:non-specific serine/threonine protein kinase
MRPPRTGTRQRRRTGELPPAQRAGGLPRDLTSFVGREPQLTELQSLLGGTPLLTLVGSGGVGKTRLALRLATRVKDGYSDGVRVVELAPLADASLVTQTVAVALGVPDQPGKSVMDLLCESLERRRLLLVLDNCEHVIVACAQLADELLRRCPGLCILATSREPLDTAGEVVWRVPSLRTPVDGEELTIHQLAEFESVQLFVDRASANQPGFALNARTATSAASICRQLDGIPLALELAAARVRALPVDQIAYRLEDCLNLLNQGTRTGPPRQQTLQATIEWSYALLSEPEQQLFNRTTVFAGGWTLEAAEAVCGGGSIAPDQVVDLLTRLVDKSMVLAEADAGGVMRYRTLETLRQFGRLRLGKNLQAKTVHDAHASYYLSLARQADEDLFGSPRQAVWLNRLELEHDNVRAALRWLLKQSDVLAALELAAGMRRFWLMRSHHGEGQAWFDDLLHRPGSAAPTLARAKALNGAGLLAWRHGDVNAARAFHRDAKELLHTLNDAAEESWTLWRLGHIATELRDYACARQLLEDSIALARTTGSLANEGSALSYLAWLEVYEGNLGAARFHADAGLAICTRLGYTRGKFFGLQVLGYVCHEEADYAAATNYWEMCLGLARELGDTLLTALAFVHMSRAASMRSEYAKARGFLAQALGLSRQLNAQGRVVSALEAAALLAARQGKVARAARLDAAMEVPGIALLHPTQRAERARWISPVIETLGPDRAAAESRIGRSMSLDEVFVYALSDDDAPETVHASKQLLTEREASVLRLLAAGSSNSEMAHELVLSVHTVERHVANIYNKTGAHGRAEATAYALRHGLAV